MFFIVASIFIYLKVISIAFIDKFNNVARRSYVAAIFKLEFVKLSYVFCYFFPLCSYFSSCSSCCGAADVATVVCVINSNAWGAGSALISQLGNFHLIGCTSRDFRL